MKSRPVALALCLSVIVIYSRCRKSESTPARAPGYPAIYPGSLALPIATNVHELVFEGSPDLSIGLSAAQPYTDVKPYCGLIVDTTETVSTSDFGYPPLTKHSTTVRFAFLCTNNVVSGLTVSANVTGTLISDTLDMKSRIVEHLTITSLNPANAKADFSVNGTLTDTVIYHINTGNNKGTSTPVFDYTFTSMVYDPVTGKIVGGSAVFHTSGTGPMGVWDYNGTVIFSANQTAVVDINDNKFIVNLETGAVIKYS